MGQPKARWFARMERSTTEQGLVMLGAGDAPVVHRDDSKTALAWVQRGTTRGDSAVKVGLPWACEYNASLSGIGIMWFQLLPDGSETLEAYASVGITTLQFGADSSYQNTAEYIASLLCTRGLALLGAGDDPVVHRGDSKTALAWVQRGTTRSDSAVRAGLLWGMAVMQHQADVVQVTHLSHLENSRADILSRGGTWEDVLGADRALFGGSIPVQASKLDLDCAELLKLCDPHSPVDTDESFCDFFRAALRAVI